MTLLRGGEYAAARIEAIANRQSKTIAVAFVQAIRTIQDATTLDQLARLMEQGLFEDALAEILRIGETLRDSYGNALSDAARLAQDFLNNGRYLDVAVAFNGQNPRMLRMFDQEGLRLVTAFTERQRQATFQAIRRGMEEGVNPRDMARMFRQSIGLTPRQEIAVENFRRMLMAGDREATRRALMHGTDRRTFEAALTRGQPLSDAQVTRMTDRYRARYIAYRAEVIGRTEALRAAHQGSEEMFLQVIEEGGMDRREVVCTWVTGRDERVRESHQTMNGQLRLLGEMFVSGKGNYLAYPGDPSAPEDEVIQCRCIKTTRLVPGGLTAREMELAQAA